MISLNDLLQTPRFSDLELLTVPNDYNDRVINSVEITETPDVGKFIPKNVLILTTAMVFKDKQKDMIPFIDSLIQSKAIGLAIKTGRFLNKMDQNIIDYANTVNFPLIHIPDYYPLGSLLHRIMNLVLETEREEIDFALDIQMRFSDLLVQDASNDLLVREFSGMIKSPILLLNPFGEIISYSQHFKNNNRKAQFYVQAVFNESKKTSRNHGSFIIEEQDNTTTHLSLVPINVHSYYPHYLMIVNPEKVPYPASVFAYEQAALVFQFNLYKNQKIDESLYANEDHFFSDILNNQLSGATLEPSWLSLRSNYGYIRSNYYQVIQITSKVIIEQRTTATVKMNEKMFLSYLWLRKNITEYFEDALVIWRKDKNEIVLILQEKPTDFESKLTEISSIIDSLIENKLFFDVGYSFHKWHKLEQSYTQAKLANDKRKKDGLTDNIIYYRDSGVEQLFNQLNQNEIIYFCESVLKDLAYPTDDSKIDLRNTLNTFLKNQGEITQTSNDLFIHRNTVKYRINRCEEILGVTVDDPEASLNIRLALKLSKKNG